MYLIQLLKKYSLSNVLKLRILSYFSNATTLRRMLILKNSIYQRYYVPILLKSLFTNLISSIKLSGSLPLDFSKISDNLSILDSKEIIFLL